MKKVQYYLVLLVYLIALAVLAPAQLFAVILDHYFQEKVSLAATEGTLWKGAAHVTVYNDNQHSTLDLGKVSWNIAPIQLMTGKLSAQMAWNDSTPFWLSIDPTRVHIEHANVTIPGNLLETFVPSISAAKLGGQINIHAENLSITSKEVLGQIDLDWVNVTSPLSSVNPVGNYHMGFIGDQQSLKIALQPTGNSPLILEGAGSILFNEGMHFNGSASAAPEHQLALKQVLQIIGNETPVGSGHYKISF